MVDKISEQVNWKLKVDKLYDGLKIINKTNRGIVKNDINRRKRKKLWWGNKDKNKNNN